MEESVRLTAGALSRSWRQIKAKVEQMVDRWFADDPSDFEEHLDRWSKVMAIVACICTVLYILIPSILTLTGVWTSW